jgi:regulator of sigma E protease
MFLLYEMISGRKPNDKFMEYAQMAGFFLLLALVLYANGNDLFRFLSK